MKRTISLFFALALVLCACGQKAENTTTWQEQYDLGIRYLSEGNYEEAIIAFAAAIKIDPGRAETYVGRGDAYTAMAQLSDGGLLEVSVETMVACENAVADYLSALALNNLLSDVYCKLVDIYLALGDKEEAIAILRQGYEATGDTSLLRLAEELSGAVRGFETVTVVGRIINNSDEYGETWNALCDQYPGHISMDSYGVRFQQAVTVVFGNKTVTIQETGLSYSAEVFDDFSQVFNYETGTPGPLMNHDFKMTGSFQLNDQTTEIAEKEAHWRTGQMCYHYRPNGDYDFSIEGYEEIG